MKRLALLACIPIVALLGCASSGSNYDEAKVTQITKGQTTEADLLAMFGDPTERSTDSSGAVSVQWMYIEQRTNGKTFIPFAGAFLGGTDSKHKTLYVTLNPGGTVETFHSSAGGMGTRQHTQSKSANTNETP